jgi:hypothetical protein
VWLLVSVLAALESEYRQSWDKGTIYEHVHLVPYSLLHIKLWFFIVGIQDDLKNILLDLALCAISSLRVAMISSVILTRRGDWAGEMKGTYLANGRTAVRTYLENHRVMLSLSVM